MSNKETATQSPSEISPSRKNRPRVITIAEARRKAFEASDKMRQAQIAYAEEEAARAYDYRVEE